MDMDVCLKTWRASFDVASRACTGPWWADTLMLSVVGSPMHAITSVFFFTFLIMSLQEAGPRGRGRSTGRGAGDARTFHPIVNRRFLC